MKLGLILRALLGMRNGNDSALVDSLYEQHRYDIADGIYKQEVINREANRRIRALKAQARVISRRHRKGWLNE